LPNTKKKYKKRGAYDYRHMSKVEFICFVDDATSLLRRFDSYKGKSVVYWEAAGSYDVAKALLKSFIDNTVVSKCHIDDLKKYLGKIERFMDKHDD